MSKLINIPKRAIYRSHIPKILKRIKIDEKIPLSFPIAIAYKNTYSSLSEKQRHLGMIEQFDKLRYLIGLNPKNKLNILKEFMSKIGIQDPQYNQSHYLIKLSEFINGNFNIDPNKTIQEIILSILESNFIPINLSSPLMTKIIKENFYVSPYGAKGNQDKKQCEQCLRKSKSDKSYEMPNICNKSDPYHIITLNRQLKANANSNSHGNTNNNSRYEKHNMDILAKELEEEISQYRKKPFLQSNVNSKDNKVPLIAKERDILIINNNGGNTNVNESLVKDNKSQIYVTQNVYSRNSSLEPSLRTNELNKIDEGDTKRIVYESMKLLGETKRNKKQNNTEQVIRRLYNPKIERKFNEYELFKKHKKLTELIILERIKRKMAIKRLQQSIDLDSGN